MSCPWAKLETPETEIRLKHIISEEAATKKNKLSREIENQNSVQTRSYADYKPLEAKKVNSNENLDVRLENNELLDQLTGHEEQFPGISLENECRVQQNDSESDSEEDGEYWDRFLNSEKQFTLTPQCGYKIRKVPQCKDKMRKNSTMVTKDELLMPEKSSINCTLSDKFLNSLEIIFRHKEPRVLEYNLYQHSRLLICEMIDNGFLKRIHKILNIGQEAVILHAEAGSSYPQTTKLPEEFAIKVYEPQPLMQRRPNLLNDCIPYYCRSPKIWKPVKRGSRSGQFLAKKEMKNLLRLKRVGIRCPEVVTLEKHILVMSFIGENQRPALDLGNASMTLEEYVTAYEEVVQAMKIMYEKANLIHANLSEDNILWHNNHCYVIDVHQSVKLSEVNAIYILHDNCTRITKFFSKHDVPEVATANDLFNYITGFPFTDKIGLVDLQEQLKKWSDA